MTLPGLLIEYLITGAIALIWVGFGLKLDMSLFDYSRLIVVLPVIYVLGMAIDIVAYGLTYWPKKWLREKIERKHGVKVDKHTAMKLKVIVAREYKDLNTEFSMRSSRDRIARGMIINSIGLLIVARNEPYLGYLLSLPVIATLLWLVFEKVSHEFFMGVYDELKERLETRNVVK